MIIDVADLPDLPDNELFDRDYPNVDVIKIEFDEEDYAVVETESGQPLEDYCSSFDLKKIYKMLEEDWKKLEREHREDYG